MTRPAYRLYRARLDYLSVIQSERCVNTRPSSMNDYGGHILLTATR